MKRSPRFVISFFARQGARSLGLILACAIMLGVGAAAQADSDPLGPYEQTLYSRSFSGDPLPDRLSRLELSVFGEVQSGGDLSRQARLLQVLSAARQVIPGSSTKNQDDASQDASGSGITRFAPLNPTNNNSGNQTAGANGGGDGYAPGASDANVASAPPGDSDYPTVTALERELFSRDFVREDIKHRLDRLEVRAFGQASPNMALVDRVDRLLSRYPNAAQEVARYTRGPGLANGGSVHSSIDALPDSSSQFVGKLDTYAKLNALEHHILNGKTYSGDLLTQRLDRLEGKVYGHTYSGESVDTRVNRLSNAYRVAPKRTGNQVAATGKPAMANPPDPAKWQSPPAVGYSGSFLSSNQGGPTAYNGYNGYSGSGASMSSSSSGSSAFSNSTAPQNIQIGSGFSSTSTGTYQFSPEMMSMLPPGIQQQVTGSQMSGSMIQQQSTGTITAAPGTVIMQQSGGYPGFQTYGGPAVQTYNYYGFPNTQTQTQSSTTVLQPANGQTTFSYSTTPQYPLQYPNGLPAPAYIGDPVFLQNLGNLEINVYGQINTIEPVTVRLGRLETALLGQIYMGAPDDQRLANLQRAYQLQSVGKLLGKGKAANLGRAAGSMMFGVPMPMPNNPSMVPPVTTTTGQ